MLGWVTLRFQATPPAPRLRTLYFKYSSQPHTHIAGEIDRPYVSVPCRHILRGITNYYHTHFDRDIYFDTLPSSIADAEHRRSTFRRVRHINFDGLTAIGSFFSSGRDSCHMLVKTPTSNRLHLVVFIVALQTCPDEIEQHTMLMVRWYRPWDKHPLSPVVWEFVK